MCLGSWKVDFLNRVNGTGLRCWHDLFREEPTFQNADASAGSVRGSTAFSLSLERTLPHALETLQV